MNSTANDRILDQLLNSIDQFARGETSVADVERCVELFVPALEGIDYSRRSRLHALSAEIHSHDAVDEELGFERSTEAFTELRSIVMALRVGATGVGPGQ